MRLTNAVVAMFLIAGTISACERDRSVARPSSGYSSQGSTTMPGTGYGSSGAGSGGEVTGRERRTE
jgi:hypothetical protein